MNNWRSYYETHTISAEHAIAVVKDGDRVTFTAGNEPTALGLALIARAGELRNITVFLPTPSQDFGWYDAGFEDTFRVEVGYILPVVRQMLAERRCDYNVQNLRVEYGPFDIDPDVILVEVSKPDEHGFCSFGASLWNKKSEMRRAKAVLAEVNDRLIRTGGDNAVHVSEIDAFVTHIPSGRAPGSTDLLGRKTIEPGPIEKDIAGSVANLIRDGDTLQIGIGSTSEWVARLGVLESKTDLGWHSETTPKGIIKLVRAGVITGARKSIHRGRAVATAVGGGDMEDMRFVDGNPLFELYPAEYVLDPRTIAAHDRMVAINSAVAVDLTGQIAAESIGAAMISGAGGQLAFAIGANLAKDGRYIAVMPSTAQAGRTSRIVSSLTTGTAVTVPRTLTQFVITEYGVADLRGKTQRQRAQTLIEIAHPDFRVDLLRQSKALYWP